MEPFSEHLGIVSPEFDQWRPLFTTQKPRVLLVEGEIDKEYFVYLREVLKERSGLPMDVEIVPYGGKDALKNTMLVGFVLKKFDRTFITFDLDAEKEVTKSLERLGLANKRDYLAIGVNQSGKNSIEGLLPERIIATVLGRETDLAMQLGSVVSAERREAKGKLKKSLLDEFRAASDFTDTELKGFLDVGKIINKAFS